ILMQRYPHSPLVAVAALRLAQLDLRAGDVNAAASRLGQVVRRATRSLGSAASPPPETPGILRAEPPESSLEFEARPYLLEARRLLELIQENRDDPRWGNAPLCELARLDSRRAGYPGQLLDLLDRYVDARLADNLYVLWVDTLDSPQKR